MSTGRGYLLSQYRVTNWVRNLRAAGRGELWRKGPTEAFTAIEVDGGERDRVIAAFHAKTPKPLSRDFDQRPSTADHPTFRMEPSRQAGEAEEAIDDDRAASESLPGVVHQFERHATTVKVPG